MHTLYFHFFTAIWCCCHIYG